LDPKVYTVTKGNIAYYPPIKKKATNIETMYNSEYFVLGNNKTNFKKILIKKLIKK
jgi:hypothetical protein